MNSLEAEYSFLAPTWKLPPVATSSMYSRTYGTTYLPQTTGLGPDWPTMANTMYNSRYIPSYVPSAAVRRNYPMSFNYPRSHVMPQSFLGSSEQQQQQTSTYYSAPSIPAATETFGQSGASFHQPAMDQYGNNYNADDGLNLTISVHPNNDYENNFQSYPTRPDHAQARNGMVNRGVTYATHDHQSNVFNGNNQRRRVQIVDHNRQTPSTVINDYAHGKNSRNSNPTPTYSHQNRTPDPMYTQTKYKPPPQPMQSGSTIPPSSSISHQRRGYGDENKHGNGSNIHEYLYGLAANPDPGSYVNAYRNHQRRLQDERLGRKSVMSEYKAFAQNGGFGPAFGNTDHHANIDKMDTERKRKTYSRVVREQNHHKIEEQKRNHTVNGQQRTRPPQVTKSQRAREYAETIERPQHLRPVVRLRDPTSGNVIIRDPPYDSDPRISS